MVRMLLAALAVAGGFLLPSAPASAQSSGYTTNDVNMRAGPSTDYPRIIVLPMDANVDVFGCINGYTWCDVSYFQYRGWVSSRYLSMFYDNNYQYVPYNPTVVLPIISFNWGYWDTWYRPYPWYNENRWRRTVPDWEYYNRNPRPRRNDDVIYPRGDRDYDGPRRNDRVRVDRENDRDRDGRIDVRRGDSIEDVMDPGRRVGIGTKRNNDRIVVEEPRRKKSSASKPRRGDSISAGGERKKNSARNNRGDDGARTDAPKRSKKQAAQQEQRGDGNRGGKGAGKAGARNDGGGLGSGQPCLMPNGRCTP